MHSTAHRQGGKGLAVWLLGIAALAAGLWLALQSRQAPPPPTLSPGTVRLDEPRPLQAFDLVDHHGQPFDLDRLRGHWTFLFFGYTHCPDVCPTTMATLNAAARRMAELEEPPPLAQFAFVSVDPERDTPEQLSKFVPYFNKTFLGVTGTPPAIDAFTRQLGIMHMKVDTDSPDGYLVDHSASVVLIDPQARFHALFSGPLDPLVIARDYQQLTHYYEAQQ
ncbi:MAG: SCO family protein [Thiohalobacteraceae bacterium]|nr:SCO family protein [Gammaproteobacteria bacterium]